MTEVKIADDLWRSSMLPEGVLERWRVKDSERVGRGSAIAEVRIEDALHTIVSPQDGYLVRSAVEGEVIEPGSVLGRVENQPLTR